VSTSSGYFKIAETAINPDGYFAVLRIFVYGTSNATIRHSLLVKISGYGTALPVCEIINSCLTGTSSGTGIRYIRINYPKTSGNGYKAQIDINFYDTESRAYEIQMLDCKNMTLLSAIAASDYNSTYQNVALSASLAYSRLYAESFQGTFNGNASSSVWTTATVSGGTAGESLAVNNIVGEASSNDKLYKLSGSPTLRLNAKIGSSYGTYAADAAANMNVCGNQFIQTGLTGTRNAGKDLFARGTISGATFVCDGTITTELAGGYSYKRIGFLLTASTVIFDGNNAVYTLDASGKLTMIDGVTVYAADSALLEGHAASYFQVAGTIPAESRDITMTETTQLEVVWADAMNDVQTTITFDVEPNYLTTGDYFYIDNEVMKLGTQVSGTSYNVSRSQCGTSPATHASRRPTILTISYTYAASTDKLRLVSGSIPAGNKSKQLTLESAFTTVIGKSSNVTYTAGATTFIVSDNSEYHIFGY